MTLRQFLEAKGFARPGSNKCFCFAHDDRKPSAMINLNNIYCFSCGRVYSLRDFYDAFGVLLDQAPEEPVAWGKAGYAYGQALFEYPFQIKGREDEAKGFLR